MRVGSFASICMLMLVLPGCSSDSEVQETRSARPPDSLSSVQRAARGQLSHLLDAIPSGMEHGYGFASEDELSRADLGRLFRVYAATDPRQEPVFVAQEIWRVTVTVSGEARALVTVAKVGDRWEAVELGAAALARELDAIAREREPGPTSWGLLRIYPLRCDLLTPSTEEPQSAWSIIPLRSARRQLGLGAGPMSYTELVEELKNAAETTP